MTLEKLDCLFKKHFLFLSKAPSDFFQLSDQEVIFPANSQPGSTQNFNVQLNNDQVPELTENFQLSTRSDFPGAVAVRPTATGIIEDDDRQLKHPTQI